MDFQPLPTPFQPYAKVYVLVPSNPLPTPVLPYPHTPKALRLPLAAWRSLSFDVIQRSLTAIWEGFDMVPMPPITLGGAPLIGVMRSRCAVHSMSFNRLLERTLQNIIT